MTMSYANWFMPPESEHTQCCPQAGEPGKAAAAQSNKPDGLDKRGQCLCLGVLGKLLGVHLRLEGLEAGSTLC